MQVEIVCEWIERTGGAEKVLDAMLETFPGSPVHTLWDDAPDRMRGTRVAESWMARTPLRHTKALALPFMSPTWRHRRAFGDPDRILVSSYVFAHHVRFPSHPDVPKLSYVHSPARYLWVPEYDDRGRSPLVRSSAPYWRRLDRRLAATSDAVATNSEFVRERIRSAWGRDATVIYPPVDVEAIGRHTDWFAALRTDDAELVASQSEPFLLGASRLVRYKRLDAVISFAASVGLPVAIVGEGPDRERLASLAARAGVRVSFLGAVSSEALYALYQRAAAFVFPPVEDFGIMPVEAMAAGAKVIVNRVGGTAESVRDRVGGIQLEHFSGADAQEALDAVLRVDPEDVRRQARAFERGRFVTELRRWVAAGGVVQA